jgi:hypothetical protein
MYDQESERALDEFAYLGQRWEEPKDIRDADFPTKPGQKLPNGGIILAEEVIDTRRQYDGNLCRRESIVLCLLPHSMQNFASWHRLITTDSPTATGGFQIVDTCSWGHYDSTIFDALGDFTERVESQNA